MNKGFKIQIFPNKKHKLSLSERVYKCECCGIEIDRDYNASINLKNLAYN